MGIRTFFLGDARWVPTNYAHIELNWARLDWSDPAGSYEELVTLAVDDEGAAGHGFVTEYAGTVLNGMDEGLWSPSWNPDEFASIEAVAAVSELRQQGLMSCSSDECEFLHPLVGGLLDRYLPVPEGLDADEFYLCPQCFAELIDQEAWSGPGFASELEDQVVQPGLDALNLIRDHGVLTRMYTTLSPHEMSEDPIFHAAPDLPAVDAFHRATLVRNCDVSEPSYLELDDGRVVYGGASEGASLDMPAAERIERVPMAGAPQVEVDRAPEIDAALRRHNAEFVDEGCNCRTTRLRWEGALFLGGLFLLARPRRRRR